MFQKVIDGIGKHFVTLELGLRSENLRIYASMKVIQKRKWDGEYQLRCAGFLVFISWLSLLEFFFYVRDT